MVKFIESELVSLKKEVNEMWTLVYNQLDRAGEAVLTFNRDQAQQVIVREKRVNAFELKIDSDVEDTIALYNPVAIDLRFVLAMFKINSDLERLGDFAEGIARFVVRSEETVLDSELLHSLRIEEMLKQVLGMLEMTKNALNEENPLQTLHIHLIPDFGTFVEEPPKDNHQYQTNNNQKKNQCHLP